MLRAQLLHGSATRGGWLVVALASLAALVLLPASAWAQAAQAPPGSSTKKLPSPKEEQLATRDNVELSATFFPSTKGKEAVPVILIPAYKGSQADYKDLAEYLQGQGHAVLAVDLRGQGGSTKIKGGGTLDLEKMSSEQYYRMINTDMERFKAFLMEKHNAGELNIDMLCVVGAEMGAIVAMEWARMDWSWPVLATGKQGQDVKALVLISPVSSIKFFKLAQVLSFQPVMRGLSVLILVGKQDSKAVREATRLHSAFKKFHPDVPDEEKAERQDLFFGRLDTSLQGSKLLNAKGLRLEKMIDQFITYRLVNKAKDYPWKERK
jgi:pimeloyl-ACP methyl ester carboxylesterase